MPYTITYLPEEKEKYPLLSDKRKRQRTTITILCAVIALLIVLTSPIGNDLRQAIQTDSMRVAEEAAAAFSDHLTAGETVYDALYAYCRYILENANG